MTAENIKRALATVAAFILLALVLCIDGTSGVREAVAYAQRANPPSAGFSGHAADFSYQKFPGPFRGPAAPNNTYTTYTVINTNDSGPGSLRQAMLDANANSGADMIAFNIPGSGVHTIAPISALPTITDTVTIDGYTQPGSSPNTLPEGNNAVLLVELNGANAGSVAVGLKIWASNTVVRGLVINRFNGPGIWIQAGTNSIIEGNFIGTDAAGITGLAGWGAGIDIGTASNTIGGTAPAARNLISGSGAGMGGWGIYMATLADDNVVQGNYIGTDRNGLTALGNGSSGVFLDNFISGNIIGGTTSSARNLISGNMGSGVVLFDSPNNTVQGNYIGTDITGMVDLGNRSGGVIIVNSTDNTIGGTAAGEGNVISGNDAEGVILRKTDTGLMDTTRNQVLGNYIGTDVTGNGDLGNTRAGVVIDGGLSNAIGGAQPGAGNIIAYNGRAGVVVTSTNTIGRNNSILSNSIYSNALGIDLAGNGVTLNDTCDSDTGANNLQNFPVLSAASSSGTSTIITGTLNSSPNMTFTVQFFANISCAPSGYGEGQTYIGSTSITTDGSCNASFVVTLPVSSLGGQFITSSATDPIGNTSEFSTCVLASGASATPTPTPLAPTPTSTPAPPTHTPTITPTATPCPNRFCDVPPDHPFYEFIMCLTDRGIMSGYADGTFRPGNDITRGQIAKVVSNAAGLTGTPTGQTYEDVPDDHTFYGWIERLTNLGVMGGYPCGQVTGEPCTPPGNRPYFRPQNNATRGQLSKIVAEAADVGGTPTAQTYADVLPEHPFYLWIERLTSLGVMGGYACGGPEEPCDGQNRAYFRPGNNVTRGQASKIVANTFYPECSKCAILPKGPPLARHSMLKMRLGLLPVVEV